MKPSLAKKTGIKGKGYNYASADAVKQSFLATGAFLIDREKVDPKYLAKKRKPQDPLQPDTQPEAKSPCETCGLTPPTLHPFVRLGLIREDLADTLLLPKLTDTKGKKPSNTRCPPHDKTRNN